MKAVKSAYSGKYEAASRDYVLHLCRSWISTDLKATDLFINQRWYKFKKKRSERKNSHLHEWEADAYHISRWLEYEGEIPSED